MTSGKKLSPSLVRLISLADELYPAERRDRMAEAAPAASAPNSVRRRAAVGSQFHPGLPCNRDLDSPLVLCFLFLLLLLLRLLLIIIIFWSLSLLQLLLNDKQT